MSKDKPMLENEKPAESNGKNRAALKKAMDEEARERATKCSEEIQSLLKKNRCELAAIPFTEYDQNGISHTFARTVIKPLE